MTSFAPYRVIPLLDDYRRFAQQCHGLVTDRLAHSEFLREHLIIAAHANERSPDECGPYADIFLLAIDLSWRVEGNRSDVTSIELLESLGACRIKLATASLLRELSGPYILKATDIMAWAIHAAARRGISDDGFLFGVGRQHARNVRRGFMLPKGGEQRAAA